MRAAYLIAGDVSPGSIREGSNGYRSYGLTVTRILRIGGNLRTVFRNYNRGERVRRVRGGIENAHRARRRVRYIKTIELWVIEHEICTRTHRNIAGENGVGKRINCRNRSAPAIQNISSLAVRSRRHPEGCTEPRNSFIQALIQRINADYPADSRAIAANCIDLFAIGSFGQGNRAELQRDVVDHCVVASRDRGHAWGRRWHSGRASDVRHIHRPVLGGVDENRPGTKGETRCHRGEAGQRVRRNCIFEAVCHIYPASIR